MNDVSCIILCCGYVEHASVAPLVFTTEFGSGRTHDRKEALLLLAEDLFAVWKHNKPRYVCCEKSKKAEMNYCGNCGNDIEQLYSYNANDFMEFIRLILSKDNDSYPYKGVMLGEKYHKFTFMPTVVFTEHVIANQFLEIDESAEYVITTIVEMLHPGTWGDFLEDAMVYVFPCPTEYDNLDSWYEEYMKL